MPLVGASARPRTRPPRPRPKSRLGQRANPCRQRTTGRHRARNAPPDARRDRSAGPRMNPDDLVALTYRPGPGRHLGTTFVDGHHVQTLADLPPLRNGLLFVGLNPTPE